MKFNVAVISGDGIGPEIVSEAKKVLNKIGSKFGHEFTYTEVLMGGVSIDAHGVPLTDEALETAKKSDAVLLGAVGGRVGVDSWYNLPPNLRPEAGLLAIRKGLGLFANLRPAYLYDELKDKIDSIESLIKDNNCALSLPNSVLCKSEICAILYPMKSSGRLSLFIVSSLT
mgnify:CR=1 FL=1